MFLVSENSFMFVVSLQKIFAHLLLLKQWKKLSEMNPFQVRTLRSGGWMAPEECS